MYTQTYTNTHIHVPTYTDAYPLSDTYRLHYVSIYIPPLAVTVYTVYSIYSFQCEQFMLHIILHILLSAETWMHSRCTERRITPLSQSAMHDLKA